MSKERFFRNSLTKKVLKIVGYFWGYNLLDYSITFLIRCYQPYNIALIKKGDVIT